MIYDGSMAMQDVFIAGCIMIEDMEMTLASAMDH